MKLALVVLAAGASERLGQCKALAGLGGRTVLDRLLEAGAAISDCLPLVVTGADHHEIARAAPRTCELRFNPEWARGRAGGVLLAHERWPDRALCLAPVDVPLVPAAVFTALARKWDEIGDPPSGWLAPRLERPGDPLHGRFGHPVIAGPELLDKLAELGPEADLRSLRRLSDPLAQIAVQASEILDDLDLPSDLERLQSRF